MKSIPHRFAMFIVLCAISAQAAAQQTPQLPQPGGVFNDFTRFMQNAVNFVTGPYATAFSLFILAVAILLWNFAPKEGFMMLATKALASCFALLSLAPIVMSVRA